MLRSDNRVKCVFEFCLSSLDRRSFGVATTTGFSWSLASRGRGRDVIAWSRWSSAFFADRVGDGGSFQLKTRETLFPVYTYRNAISDLFSMKNMTLVVAFAGLENWKTYAAPTLTMPHSWMILSQSVYRTDFSLLSSLIHQGKER